jgi:hypothetical protein
MKDTIAADLEKMKIVLREYAMPMFSDEELEYFLESSSSYNEAVYTAALLKSENTTLQVSGVSTADSSAYFLRIAQMHKPNNTGILKGV